MMPASSAASVTFILLLSDPEFFLFQFNVQWFWLLFFPFLVEVFIFSSSEMLSRRILFDVNFSPQISKNSQRVFILINSMLIV